MMPNDMMPPGLGQLLEGQRAGCRTYAGCAVHCLETEQDAGMYCNWYAEHKLASRCHVDCHNGTVRQANSLTICVRVMLSNRLKAFSFVIGSGPISGRKPTGSIARLKGSAAAAL
jgi:hypothetical protein